MRPLTPTRAFWLSLRQNRGAVAGLITIAGITLVALLAPWIAPYSPILTDNTVFLSPPAWLSGGSSAHWLGTDAIGRDLLSRLMHGARLSLLIGVAVVALSVLCGTALGLLAGCLRCWSCAAWT